MVTLFLVPRMGLVRESWQRTSFPSPQEPFTGSSVPYRVDLECWLILEKNPGSIDVANNQQRRVYLVPAPRVL